MDQAKLLTIAQLQEFLDATQEVFFGRLAHSDAQQREHITVGSQDRGQVLQVHGARKSRQDLARSKGGCEVVHVESRGGDLLPHVRQSR